MVTHQVRGEWDRGGELWGVVSHEVRGEWDGGGELGGVVSHQVVQGGPQVGGG